METQSWVQYISLAHYAHIKLPIPLDLFIVDVIISRTTRNKFQ